VETHRSPQTAEAWEWVSREIFQKIARRPLYACQESNFEEGLAFAGF
jgi:hypothetical protein